MKKMRYLGVLIACALAVLLFSGTAGATWVTFEFDPNDWVTNYDLDITKTRLQQDNPRLLIDGTAQATDKVGYAGTHTTYAGASYSSTGIAGYQNQVPGVEIHEFNMWLADGINAPNWGEVLTQKVGSVPSGTATNGWAVAIIDNPWPQSGAGTKLVQWYDANYWDDNPGTAPVPLTFGSGGVDFGMFTLTVDVNDLDYYGQPVDVSPGSLNRVWLGTMLPVSWTADPDDLVYSGNRRFEGTMELEAVPEPISMIFFGTGLVGVFGFVARRRMRA